MRPGDSLEGLAVVVRRGRNRLTKIETQHGQPDRGPDANQPMRLIELARSHLGLEIAQLGFQVGGPSLPGSLERREPPLEVGVRLGETLLDLRVEAREVELVERPQVPERLVETFAITWR